MPGLANIRVENPVVQDLILNYPGPGEYIGTRIMPVKNVPARANTVPIVERGTRRRHDTRIVPKQTKKFVDWEMGSRPVICADRAAHRWLSDQELEEWNVHLRSMSAEEFAAQCAYNDIYRDLEAEIAALVFNVASWAAGNQQAAAAAWANVAFDLPAQIDTQATVVENTIGIDRSRLTLVIGGAVWPWVRRNTLVRQAAAIALGIRDLQSAPLGYITPVIVAQSLGIKEIIIGREMIETDLTPPTWLRCWDDDAALMFIPEDINRTPVLPFGYTCRRDGHPKTFEPYRDYTREGNPLCYDVDDCVSPNLFPTASGGTTSECGFYWDNAV